MNIKRVPFAPPGDISPPFKQIDPNQSEEKKKISDCFGRHYTYGGSEAYGSLKFTFPSGFSQQRKTK